MSGRFWTTFVGIAAAAGTFFAMRHSEATSAQCWTAATAVLCGMWWVFETMPLAATSLVPLAMLPITGVLSGEKAAACYGHPIIFLFLGGFMLSAAVEYWGAHHRVAELTVSLVGGNSGRRTVFGVMLAACLVSMWISNIATALMMLPVALAIMERDSTGKLAVPLLLGVAYSASIGGIATPVGTAPNGIFMNAYNQATGLTIPFYQWMLIGVPIMTLMLVAAWAVLTFRLGGVESVKFTSGEKWTTPQKRTVAVFGIVCLGWIFREVPFHGWAGLLNLPYSHDMTVAIAGAIALFLIPSGDKEKGGQLLNWSIAERLPWGVLILFGGGIAISTAFESSGLSTLIGDKFQRLHDWPTLAIIAVLCFATTFLSEFTSNTAMATVLMPILAAMAKANGMNPVMLMIPATFSNNLAFMMPVGTPPNAVAYGTGHVRIRDMVRAGFVLNVIGAIIVTLSSWLILPILFPPSSQ